MKSRDFDGEVTDDDENINVSDKEVEIDRRVSLDPESENDSTISPSVSTDVSKQSESNICENNNVYKINDTRKLTFGIESILGEETKPDTDNNKLYRIASDVNSDENFNHKTHNIDNETNLVGVYNTSDDDEPEVNVRIKPSDFEVENTRARLALFRYSTRFSAFNNNTGSCLRPGSAQQPVFSPHSFPVTNTGNGFVWPSVAATTTDGRKDRFGFARRVGHPYQNRTPPKRKKPRTSFTRLQILELEKRFERQKYLASTERSALAKSLKMTDAQVKTWFQNRRTKWRRQTAEEREIERQAANRLLLSLQSESGHRKSVGVPSDSVCLSHFQRWQDQRSADV